MRRVLEAVPNFSEGRDLATVRELVDVVASHSGVEVLDWSADADHHRSVLTYVGDPPSVEAASVAAARIAMERIDLNRHRGAHPRIGAVDVLPFVPLGAMDMSEAVASARRVGRALADAGLPIFYYAEASDPPGRGLAGLRAGGFEALRDGFPPDRLPDEAPTGMAAAHPTAGATCVGARRVLLAWNVFVDGLRLEDVRAVASALRERDGGFPGVRALGLRLERRGGLQISMNVEDPERTSPLDVFRAVEREVGERGGRVVQTEVIGMVPDALVLPAAGDRLHLPDLGPARVLSNRVAEHLVDRATRNANDLRRALDAACGGVPDAVREAAPRAIGEPGATTTPDDSP